MKLSDFDYSLPQELIASRPLEERTQARLLVLDRKTGSLAHRRFYELPQFLRPGDVLVLNNTRVFPARILGTRPSGGKVEALLIQENEDGTWQALLRPGGKIKKDDALFFNNGNGGLRAKVLDPSRQDSGERRLRFEAPQPREILRKIGHVPLPPYIRRPDEPADRTAYQTVFAEKEGAVAAPTAGLHFEQALLEALTRQGVEIVFVTLYVGYGTFQPVLTEELEKHAMFPETYEITSEAAERIRKAKAEGRRVIACGTTVVRTLESFVCAGQGTTRLFIYPPYEFKIVDALITNFHVPKSTLLMLVSAFAGLDFVKEAYEEAVRERYRFFSYGDAMLIV